MNSNLPEMLTDILFFKQIPSYIMIVFFVFVASLLLVVIITLTEKKKEECSASGLGERAYHNALGILDKARAESLKIMSRAQAKAQGVMSSTYSLSEEARAELDTHIKNVYAQQEKYLKDLIQELLASFKSAVEKGRQENIRTLVQTTETLKKEALSDVEEFKSMLEAETIGAKEELEQKVKGDYAQVETDIKNYKEEKLKDINNNVLDILSSIYSEVIGRELDQPKYEKMVLKLLEDEIRKSGLKDGNSQK